MLDPQRVVLTPPRPPLRGLILSGALPPLIHQGVKQKTAPNTSKEEKTQLGKPAFVMIGIFHDQNPVEFVTLRFFWHKERGNFLFSGLYKKKKNWVMVIDIQSGQAKCHKASSKMTGKWPTKSTNMRRIARLMFTALNPWSFHTLFLYFRLKGMDQGCFLGEGMGEALNWAFSKRKRIQVLFTMSLISYLKVLQCFSFHATWWIHKSNVWLHNYGMLYKKYIFIYLTSRLENVFFPTSWIILVILP